MEKIFYTKPSITNKEIEYIADAAKNGWGDNCYAYIKKLEESFADFVGARHAIATSSCTGALHMGMAALGIGPGDEVILADTNWIASAAPIIHLGAKPVFVDIKTDTWCLDPEKVEAAITKKTKAILAVHLYGNLCDMGALLDLGFKHRIPVIEDSAEAIGSMWRGAHAGTMGSFGAFSFHGTKTLTTGEGGMFVTNDSALYERVLTLSNHGRSSNQKKQFWAEQIGFKYKMSNLQAALGCAQIERADELIEKKRKIFETYKNSLSKISGIAMNPELPNTVNGYWMPTLVFERGLGISRELLQEKFKSAHIDARVFFWPLSSLPMFERCDNNTNSYDIAARAINLPSYHEMTAEQLNRVCELVHEMVFKR